jgi:transcriptional regulator with XRE-family HTH domain
MNPKEIVALKQFWRDMIDRSPWRGRIDDLSEEIGRGRSYLRGLLNNGVLPKLDILAPMAEALGVTPNELLGYSDLSPTQADRVAEDIARDIRLSLMKKLSFLSPELTGKDIMRWWASNGGRLESCDSFIDRVDLFEEPNIEAGVVQPAKLGPESLAVQSLGMASNDLFQRAISPLGKDFARGVLVAHKTSLDQGAITTFETLDIKHPDSNETISLKYQRTLAPVYMPDGSTCILSYSELLG